MILNRVRMWPGGSDPPDSLMAGRYSDEEIAALADALGDSADANSAARAAVDAATSYAALVALDARSAEPIRQRAEASGRFFLKIPELPHDVHDLRGLADIEAFLF